MPDSNRSPTLRRVLLLAAAAMLLAGLLPSQAHAFKPEILSGSGSVTYSEDGDAIFSVKVVMDGNNLRRQRVSVTYVGARYKAERVDISREFWETKNVAVPRRDCYRVEVRARNKDGLTTKKIRLGRRGSDGCR